MTAKRVTFPDFSPTKQSLPIARCTYSRLQESYEHALILKKMDYFFSIRAGPGGAKNVGIDHAQGQYIGFIDSDDLLDVDFITAGVGRLQAGADCVIYDYIRFNQQEEIHNTVGDTPFTAFPATWKKLYRSELWTGIRFPDE